MIKEESGDKQETLAHNAIYFCIVWLHSNECNIKWYINQHYCNIEINA